MLVCLICRDFLGEFSSPAELWENLLLSLERWTPCCEEHRQGIAFLDCRGLEKTPEQIGRELCQALPFQLQMGAGSRRFVAFLAAKLAASGPLGQCLVVKKEEEQAFLDALPIKALPLSKLGLQRLQELGFSTIGRLHELSERKLCHLLGKEGQQLLELLSPEKDRPLQAFRGRRVFMAQADLDGTSSLEGLLQKIKTLVEDLCQDLKEACLLFYEFKLFFLLEDGQSPQLSLSLARGANAWEPVLKPLKEKLRQLSFTALPENMELRLGKTRPERHWQGDLFLESNVREETLAKLGKFPLCKELYHFVWDDPFHRIPERRLHLEGVCPGQRGQRAQRTYWSPQAIEVKASSEGKPLAVQLRRRWKEVLAVRDFWCLEDEWWEAEAISRRYYEVFLEHGNYLRLFHDEERKSWFRQ